MKPIKINLDNASKIEAALLQANGKSETHVYTTFKEIAHIADQAEKMLLSFVYKKDAAGAEYCSMSGGDAAKAYKRSRNVTSINIVRKSGGWYLASVAKMTIFDNAWAARLYLTEKQAESAVTAFKKQFSVIK